MAERWAKLGDLADELGDSDDVDGGAPDLGRRLCRRRPRVPRVRLGHRRSPGRRLRARDLGLRVDAREPAGARSIAGARRAVRDDIDAQEVLLILVSAVSGAAQAGPLRPASSTWSSEGWCRDREGRAVDRDAAAVALGDRLDDRQAEAGALALGVGAAGEALEDALARSSGPGPSSCDADERVAVRRRRP